MIDLTRRVALQLIGSATAGAMLPNSAALAAWSLTDQTQAASPQMELAPSGIPLHIEIITGQSAPEDTLLLSSAAGCPLQIRQFLPGLLVFGNRMLDLNQVFGAETLTVLPGVVHAASLPEWQMLTDPAEREYLLAESAIQTVGDGTELLTVNALLDEHGTAVVYVPFFV